MDKWMKIAVMLTAVDNMSGVIEKATGKAQRSFQSLEKASKGFALKEVGQIGLNASLSAVKASADMEEAGNRLKAVMMDKNGMYDVNTYQKMEEMGLRLSNTYAGSIEQYLELARVLRSNRISEKDILGGIGDASAKLADYFDRMNPAAIGEFAAKMKNDFGIATKEMPMMIDLLARLKDAGVGKTGEEAVNNMKDFFATSSLGLANLKAKGLQQTKELGILGGYFISRGLSASTTGTNFRRIEDTIRSGEKMDEIIGAAKKYGIVLRLFDENKNFLGFNNLVNQFNQLKNLDVGKISEITHAFGGKQGLSTDFVDFLSNNGTEKFQEYLEDVERQATLDQKLKQVMDGLNYTTSVFKTNWENVKATFGTGLIPLFKDFFHYLNEGAVMLISFMKEHPLITKFLGKLLFFASLFMIGKGMWMIVKWGVAAGSVFRTLQIMFSSIVILATNIYRIFSILIPVIIEMNTGLLLTAGLYLAVGAGILYAYNKSDQFRATVHGLWAEMKLLGEVTYNWGRIVKDVFTFQWGKAGKIYDNMKDINYGKTFNAAYDYQMNIGKGGTANTPKTSIPSSKVVGNNVTNTVNVTVNGNNGDSKALVQDIKAHVAQAMKEHAHNQARTSLR